MTDLRYGPAPATTRGGWRYVVVAIVTLVSAPAVLFAAFAAAITWSGCFLSCSEPNHPVGALLWLLTLAVAALGPGTAWLLCRRWTAVVVAALGLLVGLAAVIGGIF